MKDIPSLGVQRETLQVLSIGNDSLRPKMLDGVMGFSLAILQPVG
jgi:hypothetical protein